MTNYHVRRIVILAFSASLVFVSKIALVSIPNVELVTFLLIIFTLSYSLEEALLISTVYTIVEIFLWGLTEQFYIWTLIVLLTFVFKRIFKDNFILWALFSGLLGMSFGFLSSLSIFVTTDYNHARNYFILGLWFDVVHMIGNYFLMLFLGELAYKKLRILLNDYNSNGGYNENLY